MPTRHRLRFSAGLAALSVLIALVVWQGSFTVGDYGPQTPEQTYVFWALSTVIFLLTVLLGFILFRDAIKLYFARRAGVEGARIRTKILVGALGLVFLPTVFLFLWSVEVLNRNLDKWFSRPAERIKLNLAEIGSAMQAEAQRRAVVAARWLADSAQFREFLSGGATPAAFFSNACAAAGAEEIHFVRPDGGQLLICQNHESGGEGGPETTASAPVAGGQLVVRIRLPVDLAAREREIQQQVRDYDRLAASRKETRIFYLQLLFLITLFVLFVAVWVALFLARQITAPVTALLEAARAVRSGDLSWRVRVAATDELATLVRAFNEMTEDLEANRDELERRRRFIEAVLESIPSGVISLSHDMTVLLANSAMRKILPDQPIEPGARLVDLIPGGRAGDLLRLLKRARRTGSASRQFEVATPQGTRHLSLTVAALEASTTSGFVLVVEDTTDILRAQRAAAWHEVARRIAHELKNPITPIALSAERILRQVEKNPPPPEVRRILVECCATIRREVDSVKNLVDAFSQFARFPSAQLEPADLNQVVREALAVFEGRLEGIAVRQRLEAALPPVALDREQFKRALVNLIDNAAEAMTDSPVRELLVETRALPGDVVEVEIADTGCGISTEDKEKLFLPYFSTKKRGTGLGLAIVSHIVAEHHAQIRVEDNTPKGARFIIELPAASAQEAGLRTVETRT
jgi:nitrogen fixation/metabolism regulation signal transduction histidine kinase